MIKTANLSQAKILYVVREEDKANVFYRLSLLVLLGKDREIKHLETKCYELNAFPQISYGEVLTLPMQLFSEILLLELGKGHTEWAPNSI